jgi:hypothetical protein
MPGAILFPPTSCVNAARVPAAQSSWKGNHGQGNCQKKQTWDHPSPLQIPTKQWDMAHKQMPKKVENRGSCTEGRQDKPKNPKLNHREATTETLLS